MPKILMKKLPGECCWPVGHAPSGRHLFCCEPIARGGYCAAHHAASRRETPVYAPEKVKKLADHFGGGKPRAAHGRPEGQVIDVASFVNSRVGRR